MKGVLYNPGHATAMAAGADIYAVGVNGPLQLGQSLLVWVYIIINPLTAIRRPGGS